MVYLRPLTFWALDAAGALLLLAGLILTILVAVAGLNAVAHAPLVDLRDAFADMRDPSVSMA
jgi:hypothetical protein